MSIMKEESGQKNIMMRNAQDLAKEKWTPKHIGLVSTFSRGDALTNIGLSVYCDLVDFFFLK